MINNILPLGDPSTHFWLTRSVARAMGVNLSEAIAAGRLSPQSYSDMVTACRACRVVAQCKSWLATEAVPRCAAYESCPHKGTLEELK